MSNPNNLGATNFLGQVKVGHYLVDSLNSSGTVGQVFEVDSTGKPIWKQPLFLSSPAYSITETLKTNWSAGYAHTLLSGNPHNTTFAQLASKPTTVSGFGITDALPLSGGTLTGNITAPKFIGGLDYTTTAPTAANTDGLKFYVGTEPATKYAGWVYLIV